MKHVGQAEGIVGPSFIIRPATTASPTQHDDIRIGSLSTSKSYEGTLSAMDSSQGDTIKSVCRLCAATCGVIAIRDAAGRVIAVRGDREHPVSKGYMCPRGLAGPAAMSSPNRILQPLRRTLDGSFEPVALETALDDIAARLRAIIEDTGPETVALFKGTQSYKSVAGNAVLNAWLPALGSSRLFTTITIDQSAKQVTMRRMGYWDAGKPSLDEIDCLLIFGSNPVLSMTFLNLFADPTKRLKEALKRGMTLIVVDPRASETAGYADLHVQPWPGEDATLVASILHVILREGWQDHAFCDRYVLGLETLREAVAPFDPDSASARVGVAPDKIVRIARMFAHDAARSIAAAGTGPSMAPNSNLADHLIECLNAICGRYRPEGARIPNPGVQSRRRAFRAEVVPPFREWETGAKTSTGHGTLFGELMSGVLTDEMLRSDSGRIRALFVHGGNPAAALPDQVRAVAALRSLDLLVAVEPFMTVTAQLCDYILPPLMQYERTDTAIVPHYEALLDQPFAQYTPAVSMVPDDAELVDDWYPYWALAQRLGRTIHVAGEPLDMTRTPSTDRILGLVLRDAQVPFETIKQHPEGHIFEVEPAWVEAPRADAVARLDVMPDDVRRDLAAVAHSASPDRRNHASGNPDRPWLLTVRRLRGMVNSLGLHIDEVRTRHPYNALYVHPDDLAQIDVADGGLVRVAVDTGSIFARVKADATMRRGVVSISHCWGGLPDADLAFEALGASTNLLTRTDKMVETINAMPQMTAIPVSVEPAGIATDPAFAGDASGERHV